MFKSEFLTFFIKTYPWKFPWLGLLASTGGSMDLILVRQLRAHKPCSQKKKKELPKSILTFSSIFVNVYSFPLVSQIKSYGLLSSHTPYMISQCFLLMTQPSRCVQTSMTIYHFYCSYVPWHPHLLDYCRVYKQDFLLLPSPSHSILIDAVSAARVKLYKSCYFPAQSILMCSASSW